MQALIMAGGKGTRLMPYSATLPKPLVPIGEEPVLEILLRRLAKAGVDHAILAVNHFRHLIEAYFGDGSRIGLPITYCLEERPLGTAGPIGQAIDMLDDTFIVANGDLLTTLSIGKMIDVHRTSKADATVGSYRREIKSDFGILEVDDDMRMTAYREKPVYSHLVSMGIYLIQREAVRPHVTPGAYLDMPDLLRLLSGTGKTVRCFEDNCFWLDIGRPEDLGTAQRLWEENPCFFTDT
jgi:NDP-sugar pyrophosphorylase family protein